jgi:glutathione peroxidase
MRRRQVSKMSERIIIVVLLLVLFEVAFMFVTSHAASDGATDAYAFSFQALQGGDDLPLAAYKGKVLLIVNTASKCGFTPQYEKLEALYNRFKDQGLVIVGVPSSDFGNQEPGSNEEIAHFCQLNYGVTFPMTAKEHVSGDEAHPFYTWAREQKGFLGAPKWNFHKYLIDRHGHLVNYFHSMTAPDDPKLIKAIEKLLSENA